MSAGDEVAFTTPGGSVTLQVEQVEVRSGDGAPSAVLLEALADATAWARVDAGALLHLDPDARGAMLGGGFEAGTPVRIEAVLDRMLMDELGDVDAEAIRERLRENDPDDPLLDERSWWALTATGRLETPAGLGGELQAGLRTVWSDDPPPAGMASVIAAALEAVDVDASVEETDDVVDWIVRFQDAGAIGLALARESSRQAIVYLFLPRLCPAEHRDELARLTALVNYDLPIGCLETYLDIGQVRVRTSADVTGDRLSLAMAQNLVGAVRHLSAAWFPAALRVMDGATADAALAGE